jgi:hypothetical protein
MDTPKAIALLILMYKKDNMRPDLVRDLEFVLRMKPNTYLAINFLEAAIENRRIEDDAIVSAILHLIDDLKEIHSGPYRVYAKGDYHGGRKSNDI